MISLPKLSDFNLTGKRVIVRADLDISPEDINNIRLTSLSQTLDYLKNQNALITIIGHRGRPQGLDESLSLKPFEQYFKKWEARVLENLRFDEREEKNDESFAKELSAGQDFYVNEAFGVSHREHASIVGLPKLLPHAAGFRFVSEIENLSKVLENPQRPLIFIISGLKDDKLSYMESFLKLSDKILIGGRMPDYIHDDSPLRHNEKVVVADLLPDKEDITIHSIEKFETEIIKSKTIVVSGPIGKFEEEGHRQGTSRVFFNVTNSNSFKIAGGGDTETAINLLNLKDKFNWISVGGGAMLEFLAKGTLPGIVSLLEK
ncbi:MAG TPA: phosphoglycerate kinase [Patescibacteria group bacterium]|nr:phosphoglycerate kinase [Patescibacteria group bacterium]